MATYEDLESVIENLQQYQIKGATNKEQLLISLSKLKFFSNFSPEQGQNLSLELLSKLKLIQIPKGTPLYQQNDYGSYLYILLKGQTQRFVQKTDVDILQDLSAGKKIDQKQEREEIELLKGLNRDKFYFSSFFPRFKAVSKYNPGDHFGETSILFDALRKSTMIALSDAICIRIGKEALKIHFQDYIQYQKTKVNFFCNMLQGVQPNHISKFIKYLKDINAPKGKVIYSENDIPDSVYFIFKGEVELNKEISELDLHRKLSFLRLRYSNLFGEEAVFNCDSRYMGASSCSYDSSLNALSRQSISEIKIFLPDVYFSLKLSCQISYQKKLDRFQQASKEAQIISNLPRLKRIKSLSPDKDLYNQDSHGLSYSNLINGVPQRKKIGRNLNLEKVKDQGQLERLQKIRNLFYENYEDTRQLENFLDRDIEKKQISSPMRGLFNLAKKQIKKKSHAYFYEFQREYKKKFSMPQIEISEDFLNSNLQAKTQEVDEPQKLNMVVSPRIKRMVRQIQNSEINLNRNDTETVESLLITRKCYSPRASPLLGSYIQRQSSVIDEKILNSPKHERINSCITSFEIPFQNTVAAKQDSTHIPLNVKIKIGSLRKIQNGF